MLNKNAKTFKWQWLIKSIVAIFFIKTLTPHRGLTSTIRY